MANALQELVLRIGGDSEGGQRAVRDLSNALANSLQKALVDTGTKATESGQKVSGFAKYLEDLTPKGQNAQATFQSLQRTLTEMWENPTAGVKGLAGALGSDLSGALASTGGSLATVGVAAGGVVAVLGVAAVAAFELGDRAAKTGAMLHDLSEKTGIAVGPLSVLSKAAQVAGSDITTLSNAVFMMQKNMGENPDKFEKGLQRIGLQFAEFRRLAPEEQFKAIAAGLKATEDPVERNTAGFELMGRQFRDLAPTMMKLNEALALTADFKPWTEEQARLAEEYEMHMASIRLHLEGIVNGMGKQLLPYMERVAEILDEMSRWAPGGAMTMLLRIAGGPLDLVGGFAGPLERAYGGAAITLAAPGGLFAGLGGMVPAGGVGGLTLPTSPRVPYSQDAKLPTQADDSRIVGTTDQEMFKLLESLQAEQEKSAKEAHKRYVAEWQHTEDEIQKIWGEAFVAQEDTDKKSLASQLRVLEQKRVNEEHAAIQHIAETTKSEDQLAQLVFAIRAKYTALEHNAEVAAAAEHEKLLAKIHGIESVGMAADLKEWEKLGTAVKGQQATFEQYGKLYAQLEDAIAKETMTTADYQVKRIEEWRDKSIEALDKTTEGWERNAAKIRAIATQEITDIRYAQESVVAMLARISAEADRSVPDLKKAQQAVTELGQSFVQMAQLGGGAFGGIVSMIGQVIIGLEQAKRAKDLIAQSSWTSTEGVTGKLQGYAALYGGAIASGANAKTGGTDEQGRPTTFSETMNSAMNWKSASTYTAAVSTLGISLAVQAGVGYIKYLFRDRTLEDAARDAGEKFGTTFSKATMDAIQKAKDAGYRVVTAEMLNLDKIITDAGGLTEKNVSTFNARFHDLFSFIELGWITSTDAAKVFEQNFATFLAANTDASGRISEDMAHIIDLANDPRFGMNSAAVREWMTGQAATMATGLNDLLTQPMVTSGAAIKKTVDDAQAALDALKATGKATAAELTDAQDKLTAALSTQHGEAVRNKQALDDLATTALTTFNAAIASGQTFAQALSGIGPSLDVIKQAFDNLGLSIDDAAVRGLVLENTILNGVGGTGKAVNGLQQLVTAAMNLGKGVETPDAFAAQQRTLGSVYNQTQAATATAGGTTVNALLPFQQTLHEMDDWAKKNHLELDANTQQMIDQSRELGIWNADFKSDSEKTRDSIATLITSNDALAAALGGLPQALADVIARRTPAGPTSTDGDVHGATGGMVTRHGLVPAYLSSGGTIGGPRGTDTVNAWLTVGERVLTVEEAAAYNLGQRLMAGLVASPTTTAFEKPGLWPGGAPWVGGGGAGQPITKTYNVSIIARNDDAAERWRDWLRSDGVEIAVEELEDGRFVSRVNRALDR